MENKQALNIMQEIGMLMHGHFLLTSGRHSDKYMQCARLFEYPKYSEMFCADLAKSFENDKIDLVAGPAMGGIIMAYEVARHLNVKNVFAERDNGVFSFRRGFMIPEKANILVVEDVVTTGGSVLEVITLLESLGANVVGVGAIVDRSNGKVDFGRKFNAVISTEVLSYEPNDCPICKTDLPLVKPGSRTGIK